jgi:hypothetical protein
MRSRLLDVAVTCVCMAMVAAPFIAISHAVEAPISENTVDTDVKLPQFGLLSLPINGSYAATRSGRVDGSVSWDMYTSTSNGMKLVVSADRAPALRDSQNGVDIADAGATPAAWTVASGERKFGVSAIGAYTLARFDDGTAFRGFAGTTGVEVARKGGIFPATRTVVKLRGEYGTALATDAKVTTNLIGTAVVNL